MKFCFWDSIMSRSNRTPTHTQKHNNCKLNKIKNGKKEKSNFIFSRGELILLRNEMYKKHNIHASQVPRDAMLNNS